MRPNRGLGMEPVVSVVVPVYNEAGARARAGFQIMTLGLLSRLIMQIRRQIFGALKGKG